MVCIVMFVLWQQRYLPSCDRCGQLRPVTVMGTSRFQGVDRVTASILHLIMLAHAKLD